jgi:hypothetical protein
MSTSESLYEAIKNDDYSQLTPGSTSDYGFNNTPHKLQLFRVYQSISKFMTKKQFISQMHIAFVNENLHEKVNTLTKEKVPLEFQNDWNTFIALGGKIAPFYI